MSNANTIPAASAAKLAKDIYDLVDKNKTAEKVVSELNQSYDGIFSVSSSSITHARTGGPGLVKCETSFGMMVYGNGEFYKNHAFIVLRGTKILGDLLTDLNALTSRSAAGHSVHDGFNKAFKTLRPQLDSFIAGFGQKNISTIHCVGHSLGGALATLCSEYLKQRTSKEVYLYTFGSPRVGLAQFSDLLTNSLNAERVFRVYHRTDIVPCVPPWPYAHVPSLLADMHDYFQPSPGKLPSAEWHSMVNYIDTIGGNSWSQLRGKWFEPFDDKATEAWLNHKSPIHFNITDLTRLDKAIWYVLRKCFKFLRISASFFANVASDFSIYDTVAYVMHKALKTAELTAKAVSSIPWLIKALIRKICSLLGIIESEKSDRSFIRTIFQWLSLRLKQYCREAIDSTLRLEVG